MTSPEHWSWPASIPPIITKSAPAPGGNRQRSWAGKIHGAIMSVQPVIHYRTPENISVSGRFTKGLCYISWATAASILVLEETRVRLFNQPLFYMADAAPYWRNCSSLVYHIWLFTRTFTHSNEQKEQFLLLGPKCHQQLKQPKNVFNKINFHLHAIWRGRVRLLGGTHRDDVSLKAMSWICTLDHSAELRVAHSCFDPCCAHWPCNAHQSETTLKSICAQTADLNSSGGAFHMCSRCQKKLEDTDHTRYLIEV